MKPIALKPYAMSAFQEVKDYLLITFGLFLYSFGLTYFMLPYEITTGGVAGVGSIIFYATGFEVQNTYLIVNAVLLIAAIKVLGWKFCFRTIYAVLMLTFLLWVMQRIAEGDNGELPRVCNDQTFMACIIGACLEGTGLAICFLSNGSTGGTATVKLTESNLPAHSHSCSSTSTAHVHGFDHKHDFSTGNMSGADKAYIYSNQHQGKPNPTVGGRASATIVSSGDSSGSSHVTNITINFAHTHSGTTGSVWEKYGSANTGGMSANESHSHTVNGGGNKKASGDAHENMPPYIVKYCWERVA
jgi:hypothetical protein